MPTRESTARATYCCQCYHIYPAFVGISYTGLTPSLARQLGVPSNAKGIVVAQ